MAIRPTGGPQYAQLHQQLVAADSVTPTPQAPGPQRATLGMQAAPADAILAAAAGAEAVQAPSAIRTIGGSMLRGAVTGGSLLFSANRFMPASWLNASVGRLVGMLPFVSRVSFPVGTLVALGAGAAVGAAVGLVGGIRAHRANTAEYEAAQQQMMHDQQQTPVGAPVVVGPDGQPIPIDPETNMPEAQHPAPAPVATPQPASQQGAVPSNPVMEPRSTPAGRDGARAEGARGADEADRARRARRARNATRPHHVERGDTLWALARRYNTTIDAIVKANPGKITDPNLIYAGDTIRIPRGRG